MCSLSLTNQKTMTNFLSKFLLKLTLAKRKNSLPAKKETEEEKK